MESKRTSLGGSFLVPSVQELAKEPLIKVPTRYVRPHEDLPASSCLSSSLHEVPIIDMQRLLSKDLANCELEKLHIACKDWGFFQMINHGISCPLVEKLKEEIQDFFKLPLDEKKKFWQKEEDFEGFGQIFVVSEEQKLDWADLFTLLTLPHHLRKPHLFPELPLPFRDTLEAYSIEMKNISLTTLILIATALKMDIEDMKVLYDEGMQFMRMNYYPPCPEPEQVIGLSPHSDPLAITFLLQINEVQGLQIKKDGNWILVKPLPNAFIVNIGDCLEITANGRYKSIEHRATVNLENERLSIATFLGPKLDGDLGPAPSLITSDTPPRFTRSRLLHIGSGISVEIEDKKATIKGEFGMYNGAFGTQTGQDRTGQNGTEQDRTGVQRLELAKKPLTKVPSRYVRPHHGPPTISRLLPAMTEVPIIDMQRLASKDSCNDELEKLHLACKDWGFFQMVNHGVSCSLLDKVKEETQEFFNLPMEKKKNFWQDAGDLQGFGQVFVVSEEQKLDWGDMFYLITLPHHRRKPNLFPNLPLPFRDTLEEYSREMKCLALTTLIFIAKASKMEVKDMRVLFDEGTQAMRMNYYPPCPEPEQVMGLSPHSDASGITFLLQINEVEGLQIKKDGNWMPVKPLNDAFVVNIGDALEILTNGIYKSIEHRATVNSEKERLSIATFLGPKLDGDLGPAPSLITADTPPRFTRVSVADFLKNFFSKELKSKTNLEQYYL
ncbi:hypothetical protein OSB04_000836 [Centaurea solstitialis]|uniref:Fe2OG dioxygenase domain-containing protein n=1 Tax=Centaurea solstitialis TaxID=347529 RepID=A0AA38TPV2_9ASTR|nr:hypothetical protein OSB04_000836 [Centaurea solstitialis]